MNTTLTHSSITVLGAGSFGTALAIAFSRNGHLTRLWGRNFYRRLFFPIRYK